MKQPQATASASPPNQSGCILGSFLLNCAVGVSFPCKRRHWPHPPGRGLQPTSAPPPPPGKARPPFAGSPTLSILGFAQSPPGRHKAQSRASKGGPSLPPPCKGPKSSKLPHHVGGGAGTKSYLPREADALASPLLWASASPSRKRDYSTEGDSHRGVRSVSSPTVCGALSKVRTEQREGRCQPAPPPPPPPPPQLSPPSLVSEQSGGWAE